MTYLELSGTAMMELFEKLFNNCIDKKKKKNLIDVRLGSKQDT